MGSLGDLKYLINPVVFRTGCDIPSTSGGICAVDVDYGTYECLVAVGGELGVELNDPDPGVVDSTAPA